MEILVLAILTLMNAFFALSEIAIISVKKSRMEQKALQGNRSAQTVMQLLKKPEDFLSAIQVGITLIGIISGAYGGTALSGDVQVWLYDIGVPAAYADNLSMILVVGGITYFSIVVGELIPKTIAISNSSRIALSVAPVIYNFTKIAMPVVKLLSGSTSLVIKLLRIKQPAEEKLSEEEIRQVIKTAGRQGVLEEEESQLHQNLFTYSDQRARDLRTHRMNVEWIDINLPIGEIKKIVQNSPHSRFPVSDGRFDKLLGVLYARDFYEYLLSGKKEPLTTILQKPIYVSGTTLVHNVLNIFKGRKRYLGIVVDEFGSIEGIITLHDILQAIVGYLPDHDRPHDPVIIRRDNESLLVSGSVLIRALNKELKQELITEEPEAYHTVGGFIVHRLGRLPVAGEKLDYGNLNIEVVDMDGAKIDKVILTPHAR